MASSTHRLGMNFGAKLVQAAGLILSDDGKRTTTTGIGVITGTGAPSGGYWLASGATALYVREDASTVATAVYVTVNGGTNWTAMDPAALNGLDLNGTELILDADADTSITADTDDQIDIKISGADDFKFTANLFTALSGSVIATNTISETTAASGVTIDGLQIKDGLVQGTNITDPGNAGAIPVTAGGVCPITTAGAETRTIAAPTAIGQIIGLYFKTDGGDCVITVSAAFNQTGNNTITLNDAGDYVELRGIHNGVGLAWRVGHNDGSSLSTV